MVVTGNIKINIDMFTFEHIDSLKSKEEIINLYGRSRVSEKTVLQWVPTDTHELFKKNMIDKGQRRRMKIAGWTEDNISYRYNNYGFRTDEDFDIENPAPGNIFLGCSFTEGTGLNVEDVWAYKINTKIGGAFYNLGQAGSGLETQYRLFKVWAPILKPKKAFTLGAHEPRREFFKNGYPVVISYWSQDTKDFFKRYLSDDDEMIISYKRSFDAIKQVAIENHVELYAVSEEVQRKAWNWALTQPFARDLSHLGIAYHDYLSDNLEKWIRVA